VRASRWKILGTREPTALVDARLQLHHAAQVVSAVGITFLEATPDDSHPNLGWSEAAGALVGRLVSRERPFQAALGVARLELLLLDDRGATLGSLPLGGRTLADAHAWLARAIEAHGVPLPGSRLTPVPYDLPAHPTARGASFTGRPGEDFEELARWYGNAHAELEELAAREAGASDVRCWPHHFDIATLITLERGGDGAASRTIGVGLGPGDETYAQPYWYVSPWPLPDEEHDLPPLAGGHWESGAFDAAVLTGRELVDGGPPGGQRERLRAFLGSALAASRRRLGV